MRLVYEDQGPPFVLCAGDCVIQPPEIRHRVLEASAGVEVIEIGVPAEHLTSIDHEMELPTPHFRPEREFHGTKFVLHREAEATWEPWRIPGFEMRETGIGAATKGLAGVHVARRIPGTAVPATRHDTDILFGFVRTGSMTLDVEGHPEVRARRGGRFRVTAPSESGDRQTVRRSGNSGSGVAGESCHGNRLLGRGSGQQADRLKKIPRMRMPTRLKKAAHEPTTRNGPREKGSRRWRD